MLYDPQGLCLCVSLSVHSFFFPTHFFWHQMLSFFLSFSIYCQTLFRVLSAGVLCTLRVAGWKPTSNHIEITVGFFYLHKGWLSLHRGHPVNVPIWRTMHLSSVIPANDTRESVFGHRNFPRRERGSNLGFWSMESRCWSINVFHGSCTLKSVELLLSSAKIFFFLSNKHITILYSQQIFVD